MKEWWKYVISFVLGALIAFGITLSVADSVWSGKYYKLRQSLRSTANSLDSALTANNLIGRENERFRGEIKELGISLDRAGKLNNLLRTGNNELQSERREIADLARSIGSDTTDARETAQRLHDLLAGLAEIFEKSRVKP